MSKVVKFYLAIALLSFTPSLVFAADNKVIIGFHEHPGQVERDLIHSARGCIQSEFKAIKAFSVSLPLESVAEIKRHPGVAYVEEDSVISLAVEPSATTVSSLEYGEAWGVKRIGAEVAHARGFKGKDVKIAIIDSGIDYSHPDLKDNYKGGLNFIAKNDDPYDDSTDSHGTHVAGIIAAKDNGTGVVGVAPEASIYAIKVLDKDGRGLLSYVIDAIDWSIRNQMDIINISSGTYETSPSFKAVCDKAAQAGVTIVAAVGNNAAFGVSNPAAYDSVIAVNAVDSADKAASFANSGSKIELAAPGVNIKSTVKGGGYALLSGTSMAAPHVTGALALYKSSGIKDTNGNGLTSDELRSVLDSTALDLGALGRDPIFGFGLVDVSKLVTAQIVKVLRTENPPKLDMQTISLAPGRYTVLAKNAGLKFLEVRVLEGGKVNHARSRYIYFRNSTSGEVRKNFDIGFQPAEIRIIPHGHPGTSALLELTRTDN